MKDELHEEEAAFELEAAVQEAEDDLLPGIDEED